MRLPVPPRARLLQGLLGLTLLLVAVCLPMKESQSPGAQPGIPLQRNVEEGEAQQPEGATRNGSTPVSSSRPSDETFWAFSWVFPSTTDDAALPTTNFSDIRPQDSEQEEDITKEKPPVRKWMEQSSYPRIKNYRPRGDTCYKWVSCNYHFYAKYFELLLKKLPNCPCTYPRQALDKVVGLFDEHLRRTVYWKDTRFTEQLEHGKQPAAGLCLRSLLELPQHTPASQLCCYDSFGRLLTRGKWAGSPELISRDYSQELHSMVDHGPWNFCKGDWTIFQTLVPPNNGLNCPQRPSQDKYTAQLRELSK